jgi:hypothetical protein
MVKKNILSKSDIKKVCGILCHDDGMDALCYPASENKPTKEK